MNMSSSLAQLLPLLAMRCHIAFVRMGTSGIANGGIPWRALSTWATRVLIADHTAGYCLRAGGVCLLLLSFWIVAFRTRALCFRIPPRGSLLVSLLGLGSRPSHRLFIDRTYG